MADRAKKKERKRLKRQQKQKSLRKAASASPFKRVASAGEPVAAYINTDWRERGQALVYVLRRTGGTMAMASFLVDLWCCGLKDAFGHFDVLREEFDGQVERMSERMDGTIARVEIAEAAAVVAGGVRFARHNGFRLPRHYDRWLNFFGPELAARCKDADLSAFGVEGGRKIRYVGPMHDLRSRLIASDVETFMSRPDVEVILGTGSDAYDEYEDEEEDDDDDENADEGVEEADEDLVGGHAGSEEDDDEVLIEAALNASSRIIGGMRRWCVMRQVVAHPRLEDAVPIWTAVSLAMASNPEAAAAASTAGTGADRGEAIQAMLLARALERVDPAERAEMEPAFRQVIGFIRSTQDPDAFFKAIDHGGGEDDDSQPRNNG